MQNAYGARKRLAHAGLGAVGVSHPASHKNSFDSSVSHVHTGETHVQWVIVLHMNYHQDCYYSEEVHVRAQRNTLDRFAHSTRFTTHLRAHGLTHHSTGPSNLDTQALKFLIFMKINI